MSWTANVPPRERKDLPQIEISPQTAPAGCDEAAGDQTAAARKAVRLLAAAVGRPGDQVSVAMSGHANPGHAPHDGWGDEFITITVRAIPAPPATGGED